MILVAGGTGFVGTKVAHALRAAELPVRVLARRPEKQDQLRSWGCEVVEGDMTDAESLRRAVEGCTAVVHLVAILPVGTPEEFERMMIQGTRDLVEASKEAGVARLVLQSALGTEEGQEIAPYYHAKWEEEQAVKYSGIEHVIFRPSFIFGRDGGILAQQIKVVRFSPVDSDPGPPPDAADLGRRRRLALHGRRLLRRGAEPDVRRRRAGPAHLGRAPRADPQDAREAPPGVPDAAGPRSRPGRRSGRSCRRSTARARRWRCSTSATTSATSGP